MDTDTGKRQKNDKFASGAENAFGATGRAAEQHYPRMALGFKAQMQAKLFLEATERANDAARTRGASTPSGRGATPSSRSTAHEVRQGKRPRAAPR